MELKIIVKEWKIGIKDDKSKTIGGVYAVMCGKTEIATSNFNLGYDCAKIAIPAEFMARIEAIDEEVRQTITNNFTG